MTMPDVAALQHTIDKIEIAEMQSRYMFALDWHDAEVYAGLFTEDATLEWPEGKAEGREAIGTACVRVGAYFRRLAEASAPSKPARLRHFVTNNVIRIDGDRATARAYWFDINNDNQPRWPYVPAYGHCEDELVRGEGGKWLFASRIIYNETSGRSPELNPAW
jgi:hypothetical protein